MSADDSKQLKRRAVLEKTGAAAAAGAIFAGTVQGKPGNGNGPDNGNGPGNGNGGGPPFEDPTTTDVVFCGCSQVCICSAQCCSAYVFVKGGENVALDGTVPTCVEVEEGQIVAVADTGIGDEGNPAFEGKPFLYCNPNTACGDFDTLEWPNGDDPPIDLTPDDCDEYGTAPQFGARCGDAFLRDCPPCDS